MKNETKLDVDKAQVTAGKLSVFELPQCRSFPNIEYTTGIVYDAIESIHPQVMNMRETSKMRTQKVVQDFRFGVQAFEEAEEAVQKLIRGGDA